MNLNEFIEKGKEDSNLFWRLSSGEHQNLLDEAIEKLENAEVNNQSSGASDRLQQLSYLTRPRIRVILAELKEAINEHEKGSLMLRNEALKDYKNDITILEQILAI